MSTVIKRDLHPRDGRWVPGTEVTVETFGILAEPEYRHIIEQILGQPRARHKGSRHYVFGPMPTEAADALCAYLRTLAVAHDRETTRRWTP